MAKRRAKKAAVCPTSCVCGCSPKALGLSLGIIWGIACLLIGIFAMYGYGNAFLDVFASVYRGYTASWGGAVIGGIWGFVDAFIAGYLIAWLYNKFI